MTLYKSCNWPARHREAMKFAPAKKFHWIWWPNRQPALVFHEIYENQTFNEREFGQFSGFPCRSHAPVHRSMAPPERIRDAKNTDYENEHAGFEKIDNGPPKTTITRSTNRSQNHPRRGIAIQAQRSTSHVIHHRGTARQWNSRQRRNFIEFNCQTVSQLCFSWNFRKSDLSRTGLRTVSRLPL